MLDVSDKIFLCYAWEDLDQVQQIIQETEHEIDAKISAAALETHEAQLNEDLNEKIANSDIVIVFISKASKKSDYLLQCASRAKHLNKNILPLIIDQREIFTWLIPTPKELKFRTRTYSFQEVKSKARFFAQLKGALGLNVEEGDVYGALVHIATDRDARIRRDANIIGYAEPNFDCRIRLAKGIHQLQVEAVDNPFFIDITIEITDNNSERFINIPLTLLLKEEQERIERERIKSKLKRKFELELDEKKRIQEKQHREADLKRQREIAQRRILEEKRKAAIEKQRLAKQLELQEGLSAREQAFKSLGSDDIDEDETKV